MNRTDLHQLAEMRIREAEALLKNGYHEGAYYLAGYAIECALKACVAKQIRKHDFPDKKLINDSYTHDLNKLVGLAGLRDDLQKLEQDPEYAGNWGVIKDWSEQDRYATSIGEQKARDLISAIDDQSKGILTWLKTLW